MPQTSADLSLGKILTNFPYLANVNQQLYIKSIKSQHLKDAALSAVMQQY